MSYQAPLSNGMVCFNIYDQKNENVTPTCHSKAMYVNMLYCNSLPFPKKLSTRHRNLAAQICSHSATSEVGHWCWAIRLGLQSAFRFIPKVLHGAEVRALCRLVEFFHTKLGRPKENYHVENRKGSSPNNHPKESRLLSISSSQFLLSNVSLQLQLCIFFHSRVFHCREKIAAVVHLWLHMWIHTKCLGLWIIRLHLLILISFMFGQVCICTITTTTIHWMFQPFIHYL